MLTSQKKIVTVVNEGMVYFIDPKAQDDAFILASFDMAQIVSDDQTIDASATTMLTGCRNTALIVPDYWFDTGSYKFQSTKRPLVEAFIIRKLKEKDTDQTNIAAFFDYLFLHAQDDEQRLFVYYLQEPTAFRLYRFLAENNLQPHRITTPAFIWEPKLKQHIDKFDQGGKGFIQLLPHCCFLYFFFDGTFIFSRSLPMTINADNPIDEIGSVTFEINQSLHLFSQKAKADIDEFFLLTSQDDMTDRLAEMLGRPVRSCADLITDFAIATETSRLLGPVGMLDANDVSVSSKVHCVTHRSLKRELDWKPVQRAGMAVALFLLVLLGMEKLFLSRLASEYMAPLATAGRPYALERQQQIRDYNQALDEVLQESQKRTPHAVLDKFAQALNDRIQPQELVLELESAPSLTFKGIVTAQSPENLKSTLATFAEQVNQKCQPQPLLKIPDITIDDLKSTAMDGTRTYAIKLRLFL